MPWTSGDFNDHAQVPWVLYEVLKPKGTFIHIQWCLLIQILGLLGRLGHLGTSNIFLIIFFWSCEGPSLLLSSVVVCVLVPNTIQAFRVPFCGSFSAYSSPYVFGDFNEHQVVPFGGPLGALRSPKVLRTVLTIHWCLQVGH